MSAIFYVYILFKPWDGDPFYVGKGRGRRWLQHEREKNHHNPIMRRILAKARRLGLEVPKIKIREGLTEHQAFEIEVAFIKAIGRIQNGGPLANRTDGGEGASGRELSATAKAKISAATIGNKRALGIKRSPETIAILRSNAKNSSAEHRAKMGNGKRGVPLSEAHKAKLRAAKAGKSLTPQHRENIRIANTGLKRSEAAKESMRRSMRRDESSGRWISSINADNA